MLYSRYCYLSLTHGDEESEAQREHVQTFADSLLPLALYRTVTIHSYMGKEESGAQREHVQTFAGSLLPLAHALTLLPICIEVW